jgi:hypothetical protein
MPVMLMPSGSVAAEGRIDNMLTIGGKYSWGFPGGAGIGGRSAG